MANESGSKFIPCFDSSFVEFSTMFLLLQNKKSKWLPLIANSLAVSGIVIAEESERQHGQQPTWVHRPLDRNFEEYQESDESS
ncbi:hypothetical protein Tco_0781714 [Tanacetum coccineum]